MLSSNASIKLSETSSVHLMYLTSLTTIHGQASVLQPWIVVDDVRHIKFTDDVSDSLMDTFDDRIGLRVPSRYRCPF